MGDHERTHGLSRTISPVDQVSGLEATLGAESLEATLGSETLGATTGPSDGSTLGPRAVSREFPAIPGYEILGELGRGGMGVVFLARQVRLNRPCAIKMVLGGSHASPESTLRFLAEAEAVARLRHANVVQIHHIGEVDGLPFLELEYVEGGSLASAIDGTPWPSRRATALVEPVALAMVEAHSRGLIHRDLKPANILLTPEGTPKVIDFGLAKSLDVDIDLTRTDSIMGSPCYMAPEQAGGKHGEVGPAADLYALGVILYELLTGRPPFKGTSVLETLEQVRSTEPVSPRRMVPGLPADVETICLKCLRKDPSRRYESAAALAEDLRRFRAGEPIVARPVAPIERAWRWCRRNPSMAGLVGLVLVLLTTMLAGASWGLLHFRDQFERLRQEREHTALAEERRLGTLGRSLWSAQPDGVPIIVQELGSARSRFLPALREAFGGSDPGHQLRAAVALTLLGEDHSAYLIDRIDRAPAPESRNVILALSGLDSDRLGPLRAGFEADHPPEIRARFASTLLSCGDPSAARSMLRLGADPVPRAAFIHHFEDWHGDLARLAMFLREVDDPDFRGGLCSAVGRIGADRLTPEERPVLREALLSLYRDSPDGGVHEAAGWALRRWGVGLPEFEPSREALDGRGWFVNRSGMTMIEVPAGVIPTHPVLMLPFAMSAREVTVEQFRRFIDDPETPAIEKPAGLPFPSPNSIPGSKPGDPIGFVSLDDAALFCNWLSRREGRQACYERAGPGPNARFRCHFEADGYRVPTRPEYEQAARAKAASRTAFGDVTRYLADYANVTSDLVEAPGTRLPNGWGFYDLLGNVWETIWASGDPFPAGMVNPLGPLENSRRSIVGGCYVGGTFSIPFGRIISQDPTLRNSLGDPSVGFRVACIVDPGVREHLAAKGPARREMDLHAGRWIKPRDGESHWAFGNLLRDYGHLAEALAEHREGIRLRPDDAQAQAHLGLALVLSGDHSGATEAYRAAIRSRPTWVVQDSVLANLAREDPWFHDPAVSLFFSGRATNSEDDYYRALLLHAYGPDREAHRRACRKLSDLWDRSADLTTGFFAARSTSISADPDLDRGRVIAMTGRLKDSWSGWHLYTLGLAHYRAGKFEDAIRFLDQSAVAEANWHARALLWPVQAMAHHRLGHAAEARQWLDAAERATLHPATHWCDLVELRLLLDEARSTIRGTPPPTGPTSADPARTAEFLKRIGRAAVAARSYVEAIRRRPDDAALVEKAIQGLSQSKDSDEALDAWRELIQLQPGNARVLMNLAQALLERDRPSEAIEGLREAIRLDPRPIAAYRLLLRALPLVDDLDRAGDLVDLVGAVESGAPEVLLVKNDLAWKLAAGPGTRRGPEAIARASRLARQLVDREPTNGSYRTTLGMVLVRSGRYRDGLDELRRSVRVLGDSHYALNGFFLAIAHWHLGDVRAARAEFERSAAWAKQHAPIDPNVRRYQAEVAALLRLDSLFPADPSAAEERRREGFPAIETTTIPGGRSMNRIRCLVAAALAVALSWASSICEAGERWSVEKAGAWYSRQRWPIGCNYLPSTAINQLEMWQAETFDVATIDRELGWAQGLGFNTVRVFLHDLVWKKDQTVFLRRIERFLEVADRHQIKVMFVLFDSCWDPSPALGKQREPQKGLHNSGWVQGPGLSILKDPARRDELKGYVQGVLNDFQADERVLAWDLFNEPDNDNRSSYGRQEPPEKADLALELLRKTYAWAREVDPTQPLTSGAWVGDWSLDKASPTARLQFEQSDIISFHNYGKLPELKERVAVLRKLGRPLICTEYMARPAGSTFDPNLGYLQEQGIGAYNWGFVDGKSQTVYPWDSWKKPYDRKPATWFHDILHEDGTPYDPEEVAYIRKLTGKAGR